jgi:NitT/TauT family transport system permease protein
MTAATVAGTLAGHAAKALWRYAPLLILAAAWEAASRLASPLVLPSLGAIARAWVDLLQSGDLLGNGLASLYRAAAGLGLAVVAGTGLLMASSRIASVALGPLVELFYPMPKTALIPVTVLWLGFGDGSKILLIFLGCMLPVTIGAFNGARGADRHLAWSARSMGAGRLRVISDVIVPGALPELLNGVRTALALSFILLVSSELIVARQGLGYLIGYLGADGYYDGMFAVVLTVAFAGFAADRAYQALAARLLRWRE